LDANASFASRLGLSLAANRESTRKCQAQA
jgi:hypothetical protein